MIYALCAYVCAHVYSDVCPCVHMSESKGPFSTVICDFLERQGLPLDLELDLCLAHPSNPPDHNQLF